MFIKSKTWIALSYAAMAILVASLTACQNQATTKQEGIEGRRPLEDLKMPEQATIPLKMDSTHVHVFACPMHPEITGKEGEKCQKCGMALVHHD